MKPTQIFNNRHTSQSAIFFAIFALTISQNSAQQTDFTKYGCFFDDGLCNDNEICYDDSLLGQCLPKDEPEQFLREIPSLTDEDKERLALELEKLTDGGFAWTDVFTQCILQNLLDSFQYGTNSDPESCALFLDNIPDENDDNDARQDEEDSDNDQDESRELLPQDALLIDEDSNSITSVVPKKMILQDDSSQADTDNPDTKYLEIDDSQSDENELLIEPKDQELIQAYLENALIQEQAEQEQENEFINPEEFAAMNLPKIEVESPEYDEQDQDDEVVWPDEMDSSYMDDYPDMVTNDVRKIKKRGEMQQLPNEYLEYSNEDLSPPYYYDYAPIEEEQDQDYPQEELFVEPAANVISRLGDGGGLGSRIFNRNERLDVKKPGPFYKNSANNFFFDKLQPSGETSSEDQKENKTKGQAEYEMPLLAPVKDKRELYLEQNGTPEEAMKNYVHIALKNRFNTYKQGEAFIRLLANEFNIPPEALREKLIENQHVQFRVDSNPQDIDAIQMAKRIDQDSSLHAKIGDQIGVQIDRAAPGEKDAIKSSLFTSGITNFNLLLLLVVVTSTLAAVIVAFAVIMLIKRRKRILRKQGLLLNGQDDEAGAQDEYKQLCRDWSRSSKKADSNLHKKVQNQDSKESQRSSTSSWPEEPTTTNMDISTGHMVLAYMEDHLKNKQRLEQEWVSLCGYEAEPCATTVAFKAENKKKNRYPDKLPYDHNRVILNAMVNASSSDYINASTITDHDPRNPSYIVTQAPLSSTVADFWQMIWEQGCVVIVMLTRLQDNGHQLCHRYWPEEGSEQYHIFEVHLVSEHVWCDDYLVRSVYLKNTRTGETRTVTQFHFRSWPAHGVPTSTKALLEFRRKVNKSYRGRSCPICIHCSDGVGRSGTYTLIDMVLNRMSKGCKEIDIAAALEHIRDQRGGMVQSRQQFEFCLMAVAEEVHAILKALPQ